MLTKKRALFLVLLSAAILCLVGCQEKKRMVPQSGKTTVVTTLFPLYDFARQIGGDKAHVILLLPPGVEPHSFEPKPGDMMRINNAGLFVYTGKFMEPWVENVLKGVDNPNLAVVDAGHGVRLRKGTGNDENDHTISPGSQSGEHTGHGHGEYDPHIWLDFGNARRMVDNILDGLVREDPANKEFYTKNATAYKTRLEELDNQYRDNLKRCKTNTFVHGGHFAFNYLAARYNLHYIAAYEGSPNAEPTPKRVIELEKLIKERNIHYIFYEELIMPRIAEILGKETGVQLLKLHGAHNISRDDMAKKKTFIDLMEENLKNLRIGLECR